jgi:hypothetical protein
MKLITATELQVGDCVLEVVPTSSETGCGVAISIGQICSTEDGLEKINMIRSVFGYNYGDTIFYIDPDFTYYLLTEEEAIEHVLLETI